MNALDIALLLVIGVSVIAGFRAGLARVVVGLVASAVGVVLGFWYAGDVGAHLHRLTSSPALANVLGFFIVFVACIVVGALIARILASIFRWVGLSWLDRLAGAAFGFARGALIAIALITVFVACAPNPPPRAITNSEFVPYLLDASGVLATVIPHGMRETFHDTTDRVRRIWSEHNPHASQEG